MRARIIAALKAEPFAFHADIAQRFGVSSPTVTRYAEQAGLRVFRHQLATERRDYVRFALTIKPNASISEIAARIGLEDCRSVVGRLIKKVAAELGIDRKPVGVSIGRRRAEHERLLKRNEVPETPDLLILPEPTTPALSLLRAQYYEYRRRRTCSVTAPPEPGNIQAG